MFAVNNYAKIKKIVETKENYTVCQISISKKDKRTNQYNTTFMGDVRFCGQAHLQRPLVDQRIKITSCGVSNCYKKDGKLEFNRHPNYAIFAYELQSDNLTTKHNKLLSMDDDILIPF